LVLSFNESNKTEELAFIFIYHFVKAFCTFCGCHKRITKRHEVENPYIEAVLKEWQLYCNLFDSKPVIKEIHLGGGTPTFFTKKFRTTDKWNNFKS
jgi:oxygen-independent coproporphyrinogen-3 oxidase